MGVVGCGRPGAPVLVVLLLLIAAAALPRRALAVTDAADGNVPRPALLCFSLLASLVLVERYYCVSTR